MSETMTAKLSTFGETKQRFDSMDEQQAQTATTDTTQAAAIPVDTSNNEAAQQQASANDQQQAANTDASIVDFNLTLGDEAADTTQQQPAAIPQPTSFNWKDEIKKLPKSDILKELGVDAFAIEIDTHIKGGGQPVDYLQARAIDYNKISDDALLKDNLRKQYPNLQPSQIDLMFERKYAPLSELPEDKDFAAIQLQADAYNIRQAKIAEQQRFKISETPIPQTDEAYEQWKQNTQTQSQRIEERNNYYLSHAATKSLNESKRVTLNLGDGVAPFNFQIDKPEMLTKIFTDDGSGWRKLTSTPQGEPDVAKQQMIALFSYNPQKFIQDIFKYGQSHGLKEIVAEGQNAQRPQGKIADMTNTSTKAIPTGIGKYGS